MQNPDSKSKLGNEWRRSFQKIIFFTTFNMFVWAATGCSTAKVQVMPGEDGVNRVVVRDVEKENAENKALESAGDFCKDRNQEAAFINNTSSYTSNIEEEPRKKVRKLSQVARVAMIAGVSEGLTGTVMTSERDYESQLVFKCR